LAKNAERKKKKCTLSGKLHRGRERSRRETGAGRIGDLKKTVADKEMRRPPRTSSKQGKREGISLQGVISEPD